MTTELDRLLEESWIDEDYDNDYPELQNPDGRVFRLAFPWMKTKEEVEYLKSQIESKLAQAEEIQRVIEYMVDFNTKIPDNPNRKYYETGIEILRKIQGKCYCGMEFEKH